MKLKLLALGIAGMSAIGMAACGGGGGGKAVDAEDWVGDVCNLAIDFDEERLELISELDISDRNAKEDFLDTFGELSDSQGDLLSEFEDLGYPDVDGGKAIRDTFKEDLETNQERIDDFIKTMEDIDEDDFEDEFPDAIADVEETDLREALEDTDGDSDEIIELIEDDADCADVLFTS